MGVKVSLEKSRPSTQVHRSRYNPTSPVSAELPTSASHCLLLLGLLTWGQRVFVCVWFISSFAWKYYILVPFARITNQVFFLTVVIYFLVWFCFKYLADRNIASWKTWIWKGEYYFDRIFYNIVPWYCWFNFLKHGRYNRDYTNIVSNDSNV